MHAGWDQHGNLFTQLADAVPRHRRPVGGARSRTSRNAACSTDTLVAWGGRIRPHALSARAIRPIPRAATTSAGPIRGWLAGGGAKAGHVYGSTDDYAWNITADPVHMHDMQATIMHLVGIDHTKLTFRYQGRQFRLTDVHGHVVKGMLA
jgi:hypothetical protein